MKVLKTIFTLILELIEYVIIIVIPIYLMDALGWIYLNEIIGINPPYSKLLSMISAFVWMGLILIKLIEIYDRQ